MPRNRPKDAAFDCLDHPNPRQAFVHLHAGIGHGPAMQLVELICPTNPAHTLGLIITDDTGRVRLVNPRDDAGPRMRRAGAHLVYTCHACRRAGAGPVAGRVRLANVLDLSAALAWAWPDDPRAEAEQRRRPLRQWAEVLPTSRALRQVTRDQLHVWHDHRDQRRAFRDQLTAAAGVSRSKT